MLDTRFYQEAMQSLVKVRNEFERSGKILLIAHLRKLSGRMMMAQAGDGLDSQTQREAVIMALRQAASLCKYQDKPSREAETKLISESDLPGDNALTRGKPTEQVRNGMARAAALFHQLSSRLMIERTTSQISVRRQDKPPEGTSANPLPKPPEDHSIDELVLATLRLQDAAFSRDFLFYELAAILMENFAANAVVVLQRNADGRLWPQYVRGCSNELAVSIGEAFTRPHPVNGGPHSVTRDNNLSHSFRDGSDEWLVWVDKGQTTLKKRLFTAMCRHVELTLAVKRQQTTNLAISSKGQETEPSAKNEMVYQSAVMHSVTDQIKMLGGSRTSILLLGESGTGKELAARAVHQHSTRADKSFVAYNCSSISREIAESQMFGHRKGAFTGAHQDSLGIIRSAEGGTLFLDEIGDLSLEIQPKLLRFLENGEVHPVGTTGVIKTNIRVVAATNHDLSLMVAEGKFRADLWYRINTITITIPPLRERKDDIPLLAHHLLRRFSSIDGKHDITLTPSFVEELMLYSWPGNIRELANVIEQMVAFTPSGGVIESFQFEPYVRQQLPSLTLPALVTTPLQLHDPDIYDDLVNLEDVTKLTLSEALSALEQRMINDALARHNNNISKTAVTLGLSRFGLQRKLKRRLT